MNESSPLWAAYLELTYGDGTNRARMQWMFLPPVPVEIAANVGLADSVDTASYFHRRQDRREHKTTWRAHHIVTVADHNTLMSEIRSAEQRGWTAKPVITCMVHPLEMRDIVNEDWKTPYRLINRFERVAEARFDFKIKI